jgi:diguanylate cyclase
VAAWRSRPGGADLQIAVNLSARQLADADLVGTVTAVVDSGLPADALWLEITESTVIADPDAAGRTLAEPWRLGCTWPSTTSAPATRPSPTAALSRSSC